MSNEDQNFGVPTHTCVRCSHCFLAIWDTDEDGDRLCVDLLSGREAILAKEQGCQFYKTIMYPCWSDMEDTRVRLVIEKKMKLPYWNSSTDPYLVVAAGVQLDGYDERHDSNQRQKDLWDLELNSLISIFLAASMCLRCVTQAGLRYLRIYRGSSLVQGSCTTTKSNSTLRAGDHSDADMAS
jgi:hypothetical protein